MTPNLNGVVQPQLLYTFKAFERVTGIGSAGRRAIQKQGLRVRYLGNQGFIYGEDFIKHVTEHGKPNRTKKAG
ncbi:MAG: hypothetical protein AAF402_16505 [Pseudomonadota bacterium]